MSNFFQGTIKLASKRTLHIRPGPGQLSWYRRRGYHITPDNGSGYAIQLGTEFQGEQSAGKESWIFLRQVLTKSEEEGGGGFSVCPVEPGIYRLTRDGHSAVLSVSTDDILATVSHPEIKAFIDKLLQRYFTVKKKTGPVQNFLGACIIQTELGISFNQTAGILQMLHDFFPIDEKVKSCVSFWDDDLEDELYNSKKLQGEALTTIIKLYCGSANHHQGNLLWYMVWSRPDLMYPTNRIGSLVTMPTRALFQQIKKIFRCLAKYPHRPLFWPSKVPLDSTTTLTRTVSVDKTVTAEISNHLALHADGSENKSVYDPS